MKNKDDRFFDYFNWLLKSNEKLPKEYNPSLFLTNRWLSMIDKNFCKIINLTTNKWFFKYFEFDFSKFYRCVLPKHTKRIHYIKKKKQERDKENEENLNIASLIECSSREIDFFKKTLEEINTTNN